MQSGLRWSRSHSRRRFPVACTPYAPPSARPCSCRGVVAPVRRCALWGWSVACGQSCRMCPRPPLCFAAARLQPCALVCPSAPRGGSLSPRAFAFGFCYKFGSWSRMEYRGYRPIGLYASVTAGILSVAASLDRGIKVLPEQTHTRVNSTVRAF